MLRRVKLPWTVRVLLPAVAFGVCLAPLRAQPAATVVQCLGQVSALKDGYPQALFVGNAVQPKTIIVTGPDSYAQFKISDGSTFEVFSNARVAFRDNYPSWSDLVQLLLGRIRVQIDHSKGPNPNSVTTPTAVISVRGTVFDVSQEADDSTIVTVEEGLVSVRHLLKPGKEVFLGPNESLHVIPNQPLAVRQIDKGDIFRKVMNGIKEAGYQLARRPAGAPGGPSTGPGSTPTGTNSDNGKNDGKGTGTGTSTGPAAPPAPPGTGGH